MTGKAKARKAKQVHKKGHKFPAKVYKKGHKFFFRPEDETKEKKKKKTKKKEDQNDEKVQTLLGTPKKDNSAYGWQHDGSFVIRTKWDFN